MIQDPILLVDDEDDLRTFLREALTRDGYRVDEASNANSALAALSRRHYAVVLTDLNMPGGPTGFDLIAAVKARDAGTLCVVITGYASLETAIQAVKFGAYDFVQKPFKLAEIEAVLDRALNHAGVLAQLDAYQKDLEARVLARVQEVHAFHDEMRALNELLVDALDHQDEAAILGPFLAHLQARFRPDAHLVLLPAEGGWTVQAAFGARAPSPAELPGPAGLGEAAEGAWGGAEGHLIALRRGGTLLGAVYLGFEGRSSFQPDAPAFVLWRQQLEAALHGLGRARALVAAALARR